MKTRNETKNISITGKTLQITIISFFVANIMTVTGSVIDGFVISNEMDDSAAAAVGLVSPLVILFAAIGATTGISFQGRSLKCLSRDDCPNFDPRKQYETIFRNDDISRMVGARMIIAKAKDVSYTSMLSLNNLIIRIEDEPVQSDVTVMNQKVTE